MHPDLYVVMVKWQGKWQLYMNAHYGCLLFTSGEEASWFAEDMDGTRGWRGRGWYDYRIIKYVPQVGNE